MENFSEKDRLAIRHLRHEIGDLITPEFTDFDFLRWLHYHNYRSDAIVPKLKYHFRVIRNFDHESHVLHPLMFKYWPNGDLGFNKSDDLLVSLSCIGRLDAQGLLQTLSPVEIMKNIIFMVEQWALKSIRKYERDTGRISGQLVLVDLDGIFTNNNILSLLMGPARAFIKSFDNFYAEVTRKVVIINCPNFFAVFNRALQSINIGQKLVVLGHDWKTEILNHVDPDILPVHWGGTLVDENGDTRCRQLIRQAGRVNPTDYWTPCNGTVENLHTLTVHARSRKCLTYHVTLTGSRLRWTFLANKDFGFCVYFSDKEENVEENMEILYLDFNRIPLSRIPETDFIQCKRAGYYKLMFKNDFSWIYKLKIFYNVTIDTEH